MVMNSRLVVQFMSRLIKDARRKVFLILDNLRVYHSNSVQRWLEKHRELIEVFFMPPYSPELNQYEYLNGDLKSRVHSGTPARSQDDLEHKVQSFMKTLLRRPWKVKNTSSIPRWLIPHEFHAFNTGAIKYSSNYQSQEIMILL